MTFTLPEPEDDGLIVPEVKFHSRDKHYYLQRYLYAFSTSMQRWKYRYYVDLFSGAGIERVKDFGLDWGPPLVAAQVPKPFTQMFFNDLDKKKSDALRQRLVAHPQPLQPVVYNEEADVAVKRIVTSIPKQGSLTLVFIDPYGLHISFDSIRLLSQRRIDIIIFFPDRIDALRNWNEYYLDQDKSNLDSFLGTDLWRSVLPVTNPESHAEALRKIYENQLKTLGFNAFDYLRIRSKENKPLYRLIFATSHPMGLNLWRNIAQRESDGQANLF
ncbi:MAG: three-Cys-motif partner protein TcmP [Planctomycetota bacterium]